MKKLLALAALVVSTCAAVEPAPGGMPLVGIWQGALKVGPVELRLVLEVAAPFPGQLTGTLVSLDQGGARMPTSAVTEKDGAVHVGVASIDGIFDGKLNADNTELAGAWTQAGQPVPLVFKRVEKAPTLNRPQEPMPPFPYETQKVVFENVAAGIKLAGTFTAPSAPGPHPAVVLITGSGPQDRDEALMGHRPFLVLADHLTRQGIAVLRYDDRGFGKSTGDFAKATNEDFVADALAAVAWLRTRVEVDAKRIGLIGHSEGGVVAPRAAAQSAEIAFIVLLAGVGVPMDELLVRQGTDIGRAMGVPADALSKSAELQRAAFRIVRTQSDIAAAEREVRELMKRSFAELTEPQRTAMGLSEAQVDAQLKMLMTLWFRELLAYDPAATLRRVKCPVLALNGERDLQVAAKENLGAIRDALAAGGNNEVKTIELPGLNHLFQTCRTGAVSEYAQIEETFAPAALTLLSEWICEKTTQ